MAELTRKVRETNRAAGVGGNKKGDTYESDLSSGGTHLPH